MTTTAIDPARPLALRVPAGHYSMMDLVRSEWTKLRTVRSTVWTLGLVCLVSIGVSAIATAETSSHWATMAPGRGSGSIPPRRASSAWPLPSWCWGSSVCW